ncbi:S-layer homology domain-containing protein [Ureibacillus sp. GCM10028918]|uniref:S-layer homology domain-containing protein n=1 Tax=Ureibacillus sp. GCM10028918 TaxID=3273429 RepID=UPI0036208076
MNKRLSLALGFGLFASAVLTASPGTTHAENISNHWAYTEMNYLINQKILAGDQNGNYLPNNDVTRAEFASFLVRALELSPKSSTVRFTDVNQGDWFYSSVNLAASHNLIAGVGNGKFNPNAKINRQEMAVMIKRALDYAGVETTKSSISFNDNAQIASWAKESIQYAVGSNILFGRENNTFSPSANATRAEASTVIYRVLKAEENSDETPVNPPVEQPETPVVVPGKEYVTVSYPSNFSTALSLQANNSPKVDGAGLFTATDSLVAYYMNPSNFQKGSGEFYQFLKLSTPVEGLNTTVINTQVLNGMGNLANTADAFIQAGKDFSVNAAYLMSHALHETGKGASALAMGIEVGLNAQGNPEMVTAQNRANLTNIKKTYNVYGIGAVDKNPNKYGSETAYKNGWFTVKQAIIGGASFVKEKYIGIGQDTLYEMRWNPAKPTDHQYATHVMWAILQGDKIRDIYEITGADKTTKLVFEVPTYQGQPATSPKPSVENQYVVYPTLNGATGKVVSPTIPLNFRTYPVYGTVMATLANDTEVTVLGENGGWYKITANGKTGWVSGQYLTFPDALKIKNNTSGLNVRFEPNTTSRIIGMAKGGSYILGVKDENGQYIKDGSWYKVLYNQEPGWVSGDYIEQPAQTNVPVTTP